MKPNPKRIHPKSSDLCIELRVFLLLIILVASITFGLNVKPVAADTATIESVDSPSVVRAGETFSVTAHGTYDLTNSANFATAIFQQAPAQLIISSPWPVTVNPGDHKTSDWATASNVPAITPDTPGNPPYDGMESMFGT